MIAPLQIRFHQIAAEEAAERVFPREEYGFLLCSDGRDVYFHVHSVMNNKSEELHPGMGEHDQIETGADGPQASTVRVVDSRGRTA